MAYSAVFLFNNSLTFPEHLRNNTIVIYNYNKQIRHFLVYGR